MNKGFTEIVFLLQPLSSLDWAARSSFRSNLLVNSLISGNGILWREAIPLGVILLSQWCLWTSSDSLGSR